jgi:cyclin-dependent kinase 7
LQDYVEFKPIAPKPLRMMFSAASEDTLFVLDSMLQLNPSRRCTCKEALGMAYFSNYPGPTANEKLPHPSSILEKIKNKSDAFNKNKRKTNEDISGKVIFHINNTFVY